MIRSRSFNGPSDVPPTGLPEVRLTGLTDVLLASGDSGRHAGVGSLVRFHPAYRVCGGDASAANLA